VRPVSDRIQKALTEYQQLGPDGRYLYRLVEIGKRYGLTAPAICLAARKAGLRMYLTR